MTTTLITGANKGLGRETARRLAEAGHDVWLGARDEQAGHAAAADVGGRFVRLDVTDEASVRAAADAVAAAGSGLDVLVNNAGIADGLAIPFPETDLAAMASVLETNVLGPMRVTLAMWPLLQASAAPAIVNVSSSLGSLALAVDPARMEHGYAPVAYPASKAALNMITVKLAAAFPRARVSAVNPGYTATDLNGHQGTRSVQDGAEAIVRAALLGPGDATGTFFEDTGVIPW